MTIRSTKPLTFSVVVPVYNEGLRIKKCLDALGSQLCPIDEVILVDNNCTDDTVMISNQYPFVRVIKEPKQGLINARNCGFEASRSEVMARIDADVVVDENWSQQILKAFNDNSVSAVTGLARSEILPGIIRVQSNIWPRLYFLHSQAFFRIPILWGANMALRKTAWKKIAPELAVDDTVVHEDQDISCLLWKHKLKSVYLPQTCASFESADFTDLSKFLDYRKRKFLTRKRHGLDNRSVKSALPKLSLIKVWSFYVLTFIPGVLLAITVILYTLTRKVRKLFGR